MAEPRELTAAQLAATTPASLAYVSSAGRWKPFEHLLTIDRFLMECAERRIDRLIVEVPVRHGKSELLSRYLPAWWLGRYPDSQVMLASYEATFAASWGRKARDVLSEFGPEVFGVRVRNMPAAAEWWHIDGHEGTMVTAGIGGGITGKGADLLLIDDPVKNNEAAMSQLQRDKTADWLTSTAMTRLQPNGVVIVTMARWHEDDLAGRLKSTQDPQHPWTVLRMPALAEADDIQGRKPGEALCREMYDEVALERIRREKGSYWFSALYMQKPSPAEGILFKRAHFRYYTIQDGCYVLADEDDSRRIGVGACTTFQTVDVAASDKTTADWTVVSTWAVTATRDLILLDTHRQHFDTLEVAQFLEAENDRHSRPPMYIETFGAGRTPYKQLLGAGYPVFELKEKEGSKVDKTMRAMSAVAAYERHVVFHPASASFLADWEDELAGFPTGSNDDQVDTVAYAARKLPELGLHETARTAQKGKPLTAGVMDMRF